MSSIAHPSLPEVLNLKPGDNSPSKGKRPKKDKVARTYEKRIKAGEVGTHTAPPEAIYVSSVPEVNPRTGKAYKKSLEVRQRMAEGAKKRWAKVVRPAKVVKPKPIPPPKPEKPPKVYKRSVEARMKMAEAARLRWANKKNPKLPEPEPVKPIVVSAPEPALTVEAPVPPVKKASRPSEEARKRMAEAQRRRRARELAEKLGLSAAPTPEGVNIGEAHQHSIPTESTISLKNLTEERLLDLMSVQIKKMSVKYSYIAAQAVGGSPEDLVQALQTRAIEAFREFKRRYRAELKDKDCQDAIRFVSPRLRTYCIDQSRLQRDKIEPGDTQIPEEFEINTHKAIGHEATYDPLDLSLWWDELTDVQKKLVNIWKRGDFYHRADPIRALVVAAERELHIDREVLRSALMSLPNLVSVVPTVQG